MKSKIFNYLGMYIVYIIVIFTLDIPLLNHFLKEHFRFIIILFFVSGILGLPIGIRARFGLNYRLPKIVETLSLYASVFCLCMVPLIAKIFLLARH